MRGRARMSGKKERIDTSGGSGFAQDNPFGSLDSSGLKEFKAPAALPVSPEPRRKETLLLRKLKAGKGGKTVTEVSGFDAAPQQVEELLKRLQGRLGTGGTCKGRVIELQGEVRERVKPLLEELGYRVKG